MKPFVFRAFSIVLVFLCVCCSEQASQTNHRFTQNINSDWEYLENNTLNLQDLPPESGWEPITIPHTWNAEDTMDNAPGYRRDASWYKKTITLDNVNPNKSYSLYFEGVNMTCEVFCNGQKVGGHVGGYLGFDIDITNAITSGDNTLLIRVSNELNKDLIPSQKSDFSYTVV